MARPVRRPGERPLIYELDLVRSEHITNERLKDKIIRDGVTIYPAEAGA